MDLNHIQERIGYTFQNPALLQQAFVRHSYAQENGGGDNEVLGFIGSRVLDLCTAKLLADAFGFYTSDSDNPELQNERNEFLCEHREDMLKQIEKHLIDRSILACRIDDLGLAQYLSMGGGDSNRGAEHQASMKADLFEAILGAAALDSSWDLPVLEKLTASMMGPVSEQDYEPSQNDVEIIQEWSQTMYDDLPAYSFSDSCSSSASDTDLSPAARSERWLTKSGFQNIFLPDKPRGYFCYLELADLNKTFIGYGVSHRDARRDVCSYARQYLDQNHLLYSLRDEIRHPSPEQAVTQLETLSLRGYFPLPVYRFDVSDNSSGQSVWTCQCRIDGYEESFSAESSSKKKAKRAAAFAMLQHVLNHEPVALPF